MIHIQAGARSYELQVWWELPPWCSSVFPSRNYRVPASQRQEEEDEGLHALTNASGPGCQEVKIATYQSSRMGQGVGRQGMGL